MKYLAHSGVASRRASEEIIRDGRVKIDGEVVDDPARAVEDGQAVTVDDWPVRPDDHARLVYALNKPAGVVSTAKDPQGRPTVVEMVKSPERLYPVGRLDADTTGLILLTNDGELAHALTHPKFEVPKTYLAEVRHGPVKALALRRLREGVELEDGKTSPARVRQIGPDILELTIHEGRKRQVRRMCEEVGHRVETLQRVAFGPLRLGRLGEGEVRRLTPAEVEELRKAALGRRPGRR